MFLTVGCRVPQDIFEYAVAIDVNEVRSVQGVELIHQIDQLRVKDSDRAVDLLDAGDAVGAPLSQLVRAAPHLSHSYQHHLPRSVVVQSLKERATNSSVSCRDLPLMLP